MDMLVDGHSMVHNGCIDFMFKGKKKAEVIEWTEKNIDSEITLYLQCHLSSKSSSPSKVEHVQVLVGGYHGDIVLQFGTSVSVELNDGRIIDFEVSVCVIIKIN